MAIRDNTVCGSRDGLFIGATDDSLIEGNRIERTRYGVHYMWSHRNRLRNNAVRDSLAGYALMQSHELEVVGNVATGNRRAGMLLRDGQDCLIRDNLLLDNGQGLFVYNSLRERIENNTVGQRRGREALGRADGGRRSPQTTSSGTRVRSPTWVVAIWSGPRRAR
ncbi:MAG: NosD domain-containing protein [Polyangiales bacterium]